MRKKGSALLGLVMVVSLVLTSCAAPTPVVVEREKIVEKPVVQTVVVEKEKIVEKPVAQTVVIEKEKVVEKLVTATPEPKPLRRLVVAQGEGVESWDPPAGWDTASEWIEMNVYDCLVYPDRETGDIVGWLAEKWENTSPTVWKLNLRKGVTFHDGTPFTAVDAKFSIDRILQGSKEQFIVFDQWAFVKEVRIIDDFTIEIETANPDPSFLSALSGTGCGVVPKAYVEKVGDDGLANFGIGTGPFKVVEYDRASFVRLAANENYWGGKPEVDELVFRVIPEPSTRVAELLAGGVNLTLGVMPQDWARVDRDPNLKVVHYLTDRVYGLTLAHTPPPGVEAVATSNLDIRTAIEYAIDRAELVELAGGYGVPTRTRLTPPIPCWDTVDPPLYNVNTYDPAKAKEHMAKAGYPNVAGGPEIVVHGTFGQYIAQKEIAETVAAMLEEVGFEVKLDIREYSTFRETVYQGNNEELLLQSLGNFTTDPWLFILNYNSRFGQRISARSRYSSPAVDELAAKADTEMNPDLRCKHVADFAQLVAEDRASVELFQMADALGMSANISWTPPSDGMLLFLNVKYTD